MKKILSFLPAALLAIVGISSYSCAPTAPSEVYNNALISAPSSLSLTAKDSSQKTDISLRCGCSFEPLEINGYGGDTVHIRFTFLNSRTSLVYLDSLRASFSPSTLVSPGSTNAWIALAFDDQAAPQGTMLYDTIRVSASY